MTLCDSKWLPVWAVNALTHYNDVIMGTTAFQITFFQLYFQTQIKNTPKLRVIDLCAGNSPVTSEFPHKCQVTRKMFPFDGVIVITETTFYFTLITRSSNI